MSGLSYLDSGPLPYDTEVTYSVFAVSGSYESRIEPSQTVRTQPDPISDAPSSFAIKSLIEDRLELTWIPGARSTGTKIYRWKEGETATLITTLLNGTSYSDQGTLDPGSTYFYQAKSYNTNGEGRMTPPLEVRTTNFPLFYSIRLSWASNRETAVNREGGGYRVFISRGTTFDRAKATMIPVPYVSGPEAPTSIVVPNTKRGTYSVSIEAYSNSTAAVSNLSEELALQVPSY